MSMGEATAGRRVAVLIDFEIGARDIRRWHRHTQDTPLETLLKLVEEHFGTRVFAKLCWHPKTGLPERVGYMRRKYGLQLHPRQGSKAFGTGEAAMTLAVDAMKLDQEDAADVFVLVFPHSNYRPLIKHLRDRGKRVVVIGKEPHTAKRLHSAGDWYSYDDLLDIALAGKLM